jgi:hypothetical protein
MINQIYHVISLETLQHQSRKKKIITEKGKNKSNTFAHVVLVSSSKHNKKIDRDMKGEPIEVILVPHPISRPEET